MNRERDYLDELIDDSIKNDPGFAEMWEPKGIVLELIYERNRLGISQSEVAKRMDVPRLAITRIENNPGKVSFDRILSYARAIGCRINVERNPEETRPLAARRGRPAKSLANAAAAQAHPV